MENVFEVKVSGKESLKTTGDIYQNRTMMMMAAEAGNMVLSKVTVWIQSYNQLDKVRRCVDSVLKYTKDVDFDMILVDNGSEDGTIEFFQNVEFEKKRIVRVEKNISSGFPYNAIPLNWISSYIVCLSADMIVTRNWLSNMLKVMESDCRIGMVNPVCSHVSNLQGVDLQFNTFDEMQEKAEKFNQSDPTKWQERIRIITLAQLFRKECLYAIGWPFSDVGFIHDFGDDDIAFRIRRAGYKVVLAGDTWVCHDHPESDRATDYHMERLQGGRENFKQKYHGVDAWEDVNNFIFNIIGSKIKNVDKDKVSILGVDVKCGTPILDVKNMIRRYGIWDAELSAFTQEERYITDLQSICDGKVICDREEYLYDCFIRNSFDYIIVDREINRYHEPIKVISSLYEFLKPGGQLLFKLKNAYNIFSLLQITGLSNDYDAAFCVNYPKEVFCNTIQQWGLNIECIAVEGLRVGADVNDLIKRFVDAFVPENKQSEMRAHMIINKYWFSIEK